MKKRKQFVFFLALLTMMLMAVSANAAPVKLSKKKITVPVATKYTLKVTGTKTKVKWKSSDKKIATVSSKGVVKGIKKGNCKVTATVGKKKYTCIVKVAQQTLKLNASSKTIRKGATFTLKATVKNAKSKKIVWKSSDKAVAKVTAKGVVKGIKSGNATITATLKENKKVSKKFKVTVKTYVTQIVPSSLWKNGTYYINNPAALTYEDTNKMPPIGRKVEPYSVIPADADNKQITFSSSNPKVVTVFNETADPIELPDGAMLKPGPGTVLPVGKGTAVITATAADGGGATYSWTVNVVDMNDYIKTVTVTKENFPQLFGWTSFERTDTITNDWGETSTYKNLCTVMTNKQFANEWYCLGPNMPSKNEFAVELKITFTHTVSEEQGIKSYTSTWKGRELSLGINGEGDYAITNVEVLRVKEGSTLQYLNNRAFKATSGIKTDENGKKYVEKTCINGNVYRDYEGHLIGMNQGWGGSYFNFINN